MQLESGHLYHIYNQGNNKQQIYFNRENYLFFLKKVRNTNLVSKYAINKLEYIFLLEGENYLQKSLY